MVRELYFYKCGETFKAVSVVPIERDRLHNKEESILKSSNNQKLYNNLIRAKSTIKELILSNDFRFFVTLTISTKYDRYDLDSIRSKVNSAIRRIRLKHSSLNLQFLFVPEKHKSGAWHLHGVFNYDFAQFLYINNNNYLSCSIFDFLGFSSISFIDNKDAVSSYILKYICKDFEKREVGKHLYFCSHNLKKAELVKHYFYEDSKFDDKLIFKNDFCYCGYFNHRIPLPFIAQNVTFTHNEF